MHPMLVLLAHIGSADVGAVAKGVVIIVVAALVCWTTARLFGWTAKARRGAQVDAITAIVKPGLEKLEQGHAGIIDAIATLRTENSEQHAEMWKRVSQLTRAHEQTRERVVALEAHLANNRPKESRP